MGATARGGLAVQCKGGRLHPLKCGKHAAVQCTRQIWDAAAHTTLDRVVMNPPVSRSLEAVRMSRYLHASHSSLSISDCVLGTSSPLFMMKKGVFELVTCCCQNGPPAGTGVK